MSRISTKEIFVGLSLILLAFLPYFAGFVYVDAMLASFGTTIREIGYTDYELYMLAFSAFRKLLHPEFAELIVGDLAVLLIAIVAAMGISKILTMIIIGKDEKNAKARSTSSSGLAQFIFFLFFYF